MGEKVLAGWLAVALDPLLLSLLGVLTHQILRQQGRFLLRLEALEKVVEGAKDESAPTTRRRAPLPTKDLKHSRILRDGLKAGSVAPSFSLPDTRGQTVSLSDYVGKKVILVFVDPNCGPCLHVIPDVTAVMQTMSAPSVLVISRGTIKENVARFEPNGSQIPIAIQPGWHVSRDYGIFSTPCAFLVDETGKLALDVVVGSTQILELVKSMAARR